MAIYGWDASDFDWARGQMDLAAAVRDGIVFFTHKATEGTRTRHVRYGEALNRARAAGIPFLGAYVVPRTPGNNGHGSIPVQVDYFLSYLDAQTPWWRSTREFFLQVDTEHWGYDDVAPAHGAQMCTLLRAQTGKWVIHYAPRWAYGNTIPGDEPLWASAYGSNPAVPYRQAYPGDSSTGWAAYSGRTPTILQFGSKARIGSQPGCDINAFRGTRDQLHELITGGFDMALTADEKRLLEDTYYWARASVTGRDTAGNLVRDPWDGAPAGGTRQLAAIAADVAAVRAADTAQTAAITALVDTINKLASATGAGGSIEAAPILAAIEEVKTSVHAEVRAQYARIAAAAKAEADALTPDAQ